MTDKPLSSGAHTTQPATIGVIINPRSHTNKTRPLDTAKLLARHPALLVATPADPAALATALAAFSAAGVRLLVINGGDGTLRDVLSALPAAFPVPPEIAILPAGNTNLGARALGSVNRAGGGGAAGLERLLLAAASGKLRRRTCTTLSVSWPADPARPPLHGFLFGAAAFTVAKSLADARIHRRGVHRGFAVAATIAATFATTFAATLPGGGTSLRHGTAMRVATGAAAPRAGNRFLLLATSLDRLMFGLWPFWGAGAGAIRWLDIDAPPYRLGAALAAVLLRRPRPWMSQHGYHSGRTERLLITLDQPFMLDGEAFDPGAGIMLSAGATITVVRP